VIKSGAFLKKLVVTKLSKASFFSWNALSSHLVHMKPNLVSANFSRDVHM